MLKNSIPGIFQLAAARVTPALRCVDQGLGSQIHTPAPDGKR